MPVHHTEADNLVKYLRVDFTYTDDGVLTVGTLPANAHIISVHTQTVEVFDASGVDWSVGVASKPDQFVNSAFVNPSSLERYEASSSSLKVNYTTDTDVEVSFTKGSGGTKGAARVVVTYV